MGRDWTQLCLYTLQHKARCVCCFVGYYYDKSVICHSPLFWKLVFHAVTHSFFIPNIPTSPDFLFLLYSNTSSLVSHLPSSDVPFGLFLCISKTFNTFFHIAIDGFDISLPSFSHLTQFFFFSLCPHACAPVLCGSSCQVLFFYSELINLHWCSAGRVGSREAQWGHSLKDGWL